MFNLKMRFLDPTQILAYANLERGNVVADFGCGNGFYPIAAARAVGDQGTVYAVDVKEEPLEATVSAAKHANLKNVYTIQHDLEKPGVPIAENTCDAVILAGILHLAKLQRNILRETYRVLKTGGKVVVIEWKKNPLPFGPALAHRLSPKDVSDLMAGAGFQFKHDMPADHFHFAEVYTK